MNSNLDRAVLRFNVLPVLQAAGLNPRVSGSDEIMLSCPFCHDYKERLGVNVFTKLWHCFNCGAKGNIWNLLTAPEAGNMSMEEAVRAVATQRGPRVVEERRSGSDINLPAEFRPLEYPPTKASHLFWRYAEGRHLTPSLIRQYEIGYCRAGLYRWRLVVPVRLFGTLMTFVARWASDDVPMGVKKVVTPPGGRSSETLFNIEHVWGRGHIILTEGVFDCLALPDEAVAVLGSSISQTQIALLREAGAARLTFCFDADTAGRRAVAKIAGALWPEFETYVALLPEGADPASLSSSKLHHAIADAVPLSSALRHALKHH